jgi:drug/metabolite transporter (DMT)-like permease
LAAIVGATLAWAVDNVVTRPLADRDPIAVVRGKAVLGAALSVVVAFVAHDQWPSRGDALALIACGAVGYGASLALYLRAQRSLGAGRTSSIFALAPFVGATIALALGDRADIAAIAAGGVAMLAGVWLHATEHHDHAHRHEPLEHEHAHTHDDGHHTHAHDQPVIGPHSHWHRHEAIEHDHPHGADLHHRHRH